MRLHETTLPWNADPARRTENLWPYFTETIGPSRANYLPRSITIFADPEISDSKVSELIEGMRDHLAREIEIRRRRVNRFIELNLFDANQIDTFLTGRCDLQPWVIYYSRDGGLKTPVLDPSMTRARYGLVPCATMQNHGVVWRRGKSTRDYELWLVTARKDGCDWDWDSDIGHESAHAAFAQIPLYIQPNDRTASLYDLNLVNDTGDLTPCHLARMSYMYMEMAVIAVRGEQRHTESGLPLAERVDELNAFLKLSAQLMPQMGFDQALRAYENSKGSVDCDSGVEVFEIGAAAMRVVPYLSARINNLEVPVIDWFRLIGRSAMADVRAH